MVLTCGMKPLINDLGLKNWTFMGSSLRPENGACLSISCSLYLIRMTRNTAMANQPPASLSFSQCTMRSGSLLLSRSRSRFETRICSRSSRTTRQGCQAGATAG